jgi:hypothetical protein
MPGLHAIEIESAVATAHIKRYSEIAASVCPFSSPPDEYEALT